MMPPKYTVKQGNESLTSHSGLALIGALLNRTNLKSRLDSTQLINCEDPLIPHSDIVYSMVGLICLGKPDYEAIEPFRGNPFFVNSLGLHNCPSSATLRQRIDVVENAFDAIIKEESSNLICHTAPQITPVETGFGKYVCLDIDVSPFDNSKTSKEGVSRTYKGYDGYAPIFSYLGCEGYLLNVQLREGSQHCQKNTPAFLEASIQYAKRITSQKILLRMDSGNDSKDNFFPCVSEGVEFIIKRNLRKEDPQRWLKLAKETGTPCLCREGKNVWRGKTYQDLDGKDLPFPIVFEVTERMTKKGQALIFPEVQVDTYWTSLDFEADEAIFLYHDHGTSEQFHSELKTDMDLERLPSGRFMSNSFVLTCGLLAYNMLRLCGQESLREDNGNVEKIPGYRKKANRRRVRSVILDLMYLAGRVIHTSRRWFISFGKLTPWSKVWESIYERFKVAES